MLPKTVATLVVFFAALAAAQSNGTQTIPASSAPNATPSGGATPLRLPTLSRVEVRDNMPRAKVCSQDNAVCITITDLGESVDVMAEAPADIQWLGVGWGTAMPQADIVLGYMLPNQQFVVSDRKATQGRGPAPVDPQQDAIPIAGGRGVLPNKWVSRFQRPKRTGDQNDADINLNAPVNMIWAYHTTTGVTVPTSGSNPEFRATITKHTNVGRLVLNMRDPAQINAARQNATGNTPPTSSGATTSDSSAIVEITPNVMLAIVFAVMSMMA